MNKENDNEEIVNSTNVPLDLIVQNKNQPRKDFDNESIEELKQSILKNGIIQPIIVIKKDSKYKIVAGERRFRAAKLLNLKFIPVIIKNYTDQEVLEVSIIENIQRKDLNPVEESFAYKKLIDNFCYTHEDVSDILGKSRSYITNSLRILSLPNKVLEYLKNGKITQGHAKLLINLNNCQEIADIICKRSLTVKQSERLIKNYVAENKKQEKSKDLKLLEKKISENIGMKVTIKDDNDKYGVVKIMFKNLDELESILKRLS